jgi:hypothetical protein
VEGGPDLAITGTEGGGGATLDVAGAVPRQLVCGDAVQ